MDPAATGLYVLSYLLAVVDGSLQDKGLYPRDSGRVGLRAFSREHPGVVAGALCGVTATLIAAL